MQKTVMYPIETTARELDGVFLLAMKLALQDYRVFIGPKIELDRYIHRLKPNLYIATRAFNDKKYFLPFWESLRGSGCKIYVVDSEGGVFYPELYRKRHCPDSLKLANLFATWGVEGKATLAEANSALPVRWEVCGVPWFDIEELRPIYQADAAALQQRFGKRVVLYNSRFSLVNPAFGSVWTRADAPAQDVDMFDELNLLLKQVATDMPEETFVIRPHPSESVDFYRDYFRDFSNVFIEDSLCVRSWICASKLVFHNGCTTAIEAALLGTPLATYVGKQAVYADDLLPNRIGTPIQTIEDLKKMIREVNSQPYEVLSDEQKTLVGRYFENLHGSATDKLVQLVTSEALEPFDYKPTPAHFSNSWKAWLIHSVPDHIMKRIPIKGAQIYKERRYWFKKFRPFERNDLLQLQERLSSGSATYKDVQIHKVAGMKYAYELSRSPQ